MTEPETPPVSYDDLRVLMINCTFKRSPRPSETDTLLDIMKNIFAENEVPVDSVRFIDHQVAEGIYPDMTEHGASEDAWPVIHEKVKSADILVIGTPVWLGGKTSVCQKLIERLYGVANQLNEAGQNVCCGKVGGCIVTGKEDGANNVGKEILFSIQHIGFTIPPQADSGWIGEAGPSGCYGDEAEEGGRTGFESEFTKRNISFAAWNMLHHARLLKDGGGTPADRDHCSLVDAAETLNHDTQQRAGSSLASRTLVDAGGAPAGQTVGAGGAQDDHAAVAEDEDTLWA